MSVRPECLATSDGALISISIAVHPRDLESLLDALAALDYPVNPGIFHDAAVVTRFADGHEVSEATTLVEFPAYSGWVEDVRRTLASRGFDPACMQTTAMLEEIQSETHAETIPDGAAYVSRYRVRRAGAAR